ncbi:MAG TPA: UDP-N-acetylmuramoyl-tripeptide--D-alanyl-D-alanine ligase [Gaiellaceae bacterium]
MIPLSLAEIAKLSDGKLEPAPGATEVTGVKVDSRLVEPGDLFVAVGAGADFVGDARARGAVATLVPDDAFAALGALGAAVRDRSAAKVVGITGSTGKTSTKDILGALCRPHARCVVAESSFNNEIGVPLTLCRLEEDTEICVLELAMRGLGQIAELAGIARPQIGAITNVGPVHLELVESLAGVARAKAELLEALPRGGTAIVPADAPELEPYLALDVVDVVRVGAEGDVRLLGLEAHERTTRLQVDLAGEHVEVELNFTALYHVDNALVALAVYRALGLPLAEAARGAREIAFSRWRGEEVPLPGGGLLINDAYNANPVSMRAALALLASRAGSRRRVAILGDMAELGSDGPTYHVEIGAAAADAGIHALVAIGPLARGYVDGATGVEAVWAPTLEEGLEAAARIVEPGDCVLVKASRAMGLEAVAEALAAEVVTP